MATTISTGSAKAPSESLRKSIAKYSSGQYSKRDMNRVLSQAAEQDPGCCDAIQEFLDDQLHTRKMTTVDHRELSSILDSLTTEGLPTESAREKPAASGLYKIDGEGTLILASDEERAKKRNLGQKKSAQSATAAAEEPHPSTRLARGSVLRERYRLEEEVARGSMGLVFRATDLLKMESGANSPTVAVKVINPEFANNNAALKSFQNEVANTQHLSHPNIVNLFELDKCDDHYYITMEWLEGEALDVLLDRSKGSALPPVQAYAIIEQLCDALIYAHERRVVHADIKPGNVFLTASGELKLIDFGIAHLQEAADAEASAGEKKKSIALTPAYASCECLEKQPPTAQDDLFSLACLVYRLLSGRRVFGAMTALQAEEEGVQPVPVGGISDTRWQAIKKALAFRRVDRQQDVKAFAEEFGRREEPREPASEVDDLKFTDTANLDESEMNLDQALARGPELSSIVIEEDGSDLLSDSQLFGDASAELSAASLLSFDDLEESAGTDGPSLQESPDAVAAMEPQELNALPEPINFFDDDCDDSAFVPVDERAPAESTLPMEVSAVTESTAPLESTAPIEAIGMPLVTLDDTPSVTTESSGSPIDDLGMLLTEVSLDLPAEEKPNGDSLASDGPQEGQVKPEDWGYTEVPAAEAVEVTEPQNQPAAAPVENAGAGEAETAAEADAPNPSGVALERLMQPAAVRPDVSSAHRFLAMLEERSMLLAGVGMLALLFAFGGTIFTRNNGPVESSAQPGVGANPGSNSVAVAVPSVSIVGQPDARADGADNGSNRLLNRADTGIALAGTAVPVDFGAPVQTTVEGGVAALVSDSSGAAQSISPEMRELNEQAQLALDEGRLVGPDNDNAASWLERMRVGEPDVAFTQAIEAGLIAALVDRTEQAIAEKSVSDAVYWRDRAAEYGADETALATLNYSIENLRATAKVAGSVSTAVPVYQTITLPLSELEFVNFQEPEYPQLFAESGLEGWVDLRFTVRPDGIPVEIEVVGTDLPPRFAVPSMEAVRSWRFKPHQVDGAPVVVKSSARLNYSQ